MERTFTLFYSWQSDLPNSTNRGFIQDALEHAIQNVSGELKLEVTLDKDTQGLSGSPDIASAILKKIDESDAFVCDLSFVNSGAAFPDGKLCRLSPNANVLVELGYAIKVLGWERIFLIVNEFYGPIKELPFDIDRRRAKGYDLAPNSDKKSAKKSLQSTTTDAIRAFVNLGSCDVLAEPTISAVDMAIDALNQGKNNAGALVKKTWGNLFDRIKQLNPEFDANENLVSKYEEQMQQALADSVVLSVEFARLSQAVSSASDPMADRALFTGFQSLLDCYDPRQVKFKPQGVTTFTEIDSDFFRFIGHEWFVVMTACFLHDEQWKRLDSILRRPLTQAEFGSSVQRAAYFGKISHYITLYNWNPRDLQRHALALKDRHEQTPLAEIVSWQEFYEADYVLFLRGQLSFAASDLTPDDPPIWGMRTAPLVNSLPPFAIRLQSRAFAQEAVFALSLSSTDELQGQANRRRNILDPKGAFGESKAFFFKPRLAFDVDSLISI